MSDPGIDLLRGKRLGKWERSILLACRLPGHAIGTPIKMDGATRSQKVSLARAAKSLESVELLQVETMRRAIKTRDRRCAEPIYRDGAFYRRRDPSKVQWVNCRVGWLTSFGAGIKTEYMTELRDQRPIRWTTKKLEHAYEIGATEFYMSPHIQAGDREETAKMLARAPAINKELIPIAPPGGDDNTYRWVFSIRCAVGELGTVGSRRLWDRSVEIFDSGKSDQEIFERAPSSPTYPGRRTAKSKDLGQHPRSLLR